MKNIKFLGIYFSWFVSCYLLLGITIIVNLLNYNYYVVKYANSVHRDKKISFVSRDAMKNIYFVVYIYLF